MVFDPAKISFVDILRWFWEAHDPTQGMGQGNDRGTQVWTEVRLSCEVQGMGQGNDRGTQTWGVR